MEHPGDLREGRLTLRVRAAGLMWTGRWGREGMILWPEGEWGLVLLEWKGGALRPNQPSPPGAHEPRKTPPFFPTAASTHRASLFPSFKTVKKCVT